MLRTRWKVSAVVLLTSCAIASLAIGLLLSNREGGHGSATSKAVAETAGSNATKRRTFIPDGKPVYIGLYSTDHFGDPVSDLYKANMDVIACLGRTQGIDVIKSLTNRTSAMRIVLDPDLLRANGLTSGEMMDLLKPSATRISNERIDEGTGKVFQVKEYEILIVGRYNRPEQFENIIVKAKRDGEILKLKDVGRAAETAFDIPAVSTDMDGIPASVVFLKPYATWSGAMAVASLETDLKEINTKRFARDVKTQIIPPDSEDVIYAVIEAPLDSTLDDTRNICHKLLAIAKRNDEIESVWTLAGYDIRTETRSPNLGTCLIQLKSRPGRMLTARQIIGNLEEKSRKLDVLLEFLEPPAFSVFVAAGGFSVRVLDKTNSINNWRLQENRETLMANLLNRNDLASFFTFLASNYPKHELIINNDTATQNGLSISTTLEHLAQNFGGSVQSQQTLKQFVDDPSTLSIKNNRGEPVSYSSFLQFKKKRGLIEIDR